jgi:tripartite-type tricarboxylate transporter receptor subunit TctC
MNSVPNFQEDTASHVLSMSWPSSRAKGNGRPLKRLTVAIATILLALSGHDALSQTSANIKIIVPSSAGGGADAMSRLLAEHISRSHDQTLVVENRPGAGNTIGTEFVSRSAPDGNTLLIVTPEFVINAHLRKLNYDPLTSFEPICYLARSPQLIVVNSMSPYRTLGDLFNAARAKPNELTLASAGPASGAHIAFEALKREANVNITFVPYPGSPPAVNALLGGHLTSVFASFSNVAELVRSGTLRALATASLTRIEEMPNVPTVAEVGFKDFEADIWYGLVAPAKTPSVTIAQRAAWFKEALENPDIKQKLGAQGQFPVTKCGAEFNVFIRKQHETFGRAIHDANIKIQ